MPQAVTMHFLSYVALRTPAGLAGFLDILDAAPNFTPDQWGLDERGRIPYRASDRQVLIEAICTTKARFVTPALRRRKAFAYEAHFEAYADGYGHIWFDFDPGPEPAELVRLFAFADALAAYFRPALGFIHRFWRIGERSQDYDASARADVQRFGLERLCARNWYGRQLTALVGLPLLESSGAVVERMPWNGVRIDLLEGPWGVEPEVLASAQMRIMETLSRSGAYGDYTDFLNQKPGPRWIPIADTHPVLPAARWLQPALPDADLLTSGLTSGPTAPALPGTTAPIDPPVVGRLKRSIFDKVRVPMADISGLDLRRIDLSEVDTTRMLAIGTRLDDAVLTGAHLVEASIEDSVLTRVHLEGSSLGMARMERVDLRESNLRNCSFTLASCIDSDLSGADLTEANLLETSFSGSDMTDAVLRRVRADGCSFSKARLIRADLTGGSFVGALFRRTDLSQANLTGADLSNADCTNADFRGATLTGVTWTGAQLDNARVDPWVVIERPE